MEPEVFIKCKKEDEEIVKQVMEGAVTEYKALMKKEVKVFFNREVPCKVSLDTGRNLPLYND
jgi:hypothetical protein